MTDSLHRASILALGALSVWFVFDTRTRRIGWLILATALVLGAVEAFGQENTCSQVRGYITATDNSTSDSGSTRRSDGDFIDITRLDMGVGYDEMRATVVTDPKSWTPGCDGIDLDLDYSVALLTGFSIPIAWVSAGPFETDCVGSWPCQKDGSIQLTIRPGQQLDLGAGISGGATGHATWIFSGPFHVVPQRFSLDTKQAMKKVSDALDKYTLAASAGAGVAKLLQKLPYAKAIGLSGAISGGISALIKQVLQYDPWDDTETVFVPKPLPMPKGIPAKYQGWIRNQLEMQRWWKGVYVALNRVNTSVATGNQRNEDRQQGAIENDMTKLRKLALREIQFRKRFAKDFRQFDLQLDDPELIAAYSEATHGQ